jgi:squalene synthase HpnC
MASVAFHGDVAALRDAPENPWLDRPSNGAAPPAFLPAPEAVMARARRENFPVASRVLPRAQRSHLLAIYGFARLVDDVGDEVPGDRAALLDHLDRELDRLFGGERPDDPIIRELEPTVRCLALPPEPFRRLILANRRDQVVTRYRTFDELLDYCRLSAAPVGELVLYVFGAATPDRIRLSDRVCAGLQVTEHLQDVVEDRARGRIYIPTEDLERFGCAAADLDSASGPRLRALLAFEADRARRLLGDGAPLVRRLPIRPAAAVAAFIAGGRAALGALERASYDIARRPRPSRPAFAIELIRTVAGR